MTSHDVAVTSPQEQRLAKQGLKGSSYRLASARSEDDALVALHEALGWVYSLQEWHKRRLGTARYFQECARSPQGETVVGMVWARRFAVHELAITGDLGDVYSDAHTEMSGVLVWREVAGLPARDRDKYGRDIHYQARVASKPVPDTLIIAKRFLMVIVSTVS